MRLAYLCNLYPAVSHSFVRREIEAVERTGHQVHRFSVRSARADLRDRADLGEVERTEVVLASGVPRLLFATLILLFLRPIRSLRSAAASARGVSGP